MVEFRHLFSESHGFDFRNGELGFLPSLPESLLIKSRYHMTFKIYLSIRTKIFRSLLNFQIESFYFNKKPFFSSFLLRVCGKFSVLDHPIGDI